MSFFRQPRPRRFHHEYIYVDERKERLQRIEQRAKETLGLATHRPVDREQLHEAFKAAMPHMACRKRRHSPARQLLETGFLAFLLVLFSLLLMFLL